MKLNCCGISEFHVLLNVVGKEAIGSGDEILVKARVLHGCCPLFVSVGRLLPLCVSGRPAEYDCIFRFRNVYGLTVSEGIAFSVGGHKDGSIDPIIRVGIFLG